MSPAADPVVFVGPSLEPEAATLLLPRARIEPPIGRGDLARMRSEGVTAALIVDGVFAHRLAVAPSEIVLALCDGMRVIGAGSIGAIRAAECWPAGMEGVGAVYSLFRLGVICDDDEVAVATDPERSFAAVSVALINARYAVISALQQGLLTRSQGRRVLTAAKRTHFSERLWESIFDAAEVAPTRSLLEICDRTDVKRRDATRALQQLSRESPRFTALAARRAQPPPPAARYVGHDPNLGYPVVTLRHELARWLLAGGRYRRYVPPNARVEPDGDFAAELWSSLARREALHGELMRWYAVKRACALEPGGHVDGLELSEVADAVAAEHGYRDWSDLEARIQGGTVGGIAFEWIDHACKSIALARRNLQMTRQHVSCSVQGRA